MDSVAIKNEITTDTRRVIVSLTTYPGRIDRVHITIESLLRQTVPADMIVLWLAEEQFPEKENELPAALLAQKDRGLVIEWCSDIKSYKKIIPSAEKWPEDILITADDDIIYEMNTIERLLESYKRHPDCVSTLRTHLMMFDEIGNPRRYVDWMPEYSGFIDQPYMALFPTTGAGTLFPPGILPQETFNRDAFMSLCPKADDIWVKCMLTLAGVKVVLVDVNTKLQYVEGTQTETLYSYNLVGNDQQLQAVLERYNQIGGEENPEDTLLARMNDLRDYEPKSELCQKYRKGRSFVNEKTGVRVSIIIIARNDEKYIKRCLKTAVSQSISDIEIICVDNGSTDSTHQTIAAIAEQDSRVKLISLAEAVDPSKARRTAVLESRGEYVLFPEVSGILAPDACEQLYERAENSDADIFAFSRGVLDTQTGNAHPVFSGSIGRIRNKEIIAREFSAEQDPQGRLHSCIFGGRICRKAYYHAENTPSGSDIYDYFLLCRASEVYVGEETQIYYASPAKQKDSLADLASAAKSIEEYLSFARLSDQFMPIVDAQRQRMTYDSLAAWISAPRSDRAGLFDNILEAWDVPDLVSSFVKLLDVHGSAVLREFISMRLPEIPDRKIENAGFIITDLAYARELFTTTELLDCVAVSRKTTLIGMEKSDTANTVLSAKTNYAGADLKDEECADPYIFAARLDNVITQEGIDCLILSAGEPRFVQLALHARLRGIPVIAALTDSLYSPMMDCTVPAAGLSSLRLAAMCVTDSPAQQRLLDALGLPVRYISRPALRAMGGRNVRATANAVLWTGEPENNRSGMDEALAIFALVRKGSPDARMLMYFDGPCDLDALGETMPEGVTVRRLRPDYGIFSDAAVHLVTGTSGVISSALRAGRTLGVPAVMYRFTDEQDSGAGGVTVHNGDRASAASEILRLFEDKKRREHLGAQSKISTGAADRDETARRWSELLDEVPSFSRRPVRLPEDELGRTLSTLFSGYEDGARVNARQLAEYAMRCEDFEQRFIQSEERRTTETEALSSALEETRAKLKQKERACSDAAARLEDITSSTTYKVGSALTLIPRYIKKLIRRFTGGEE